MVAFDTIFPADALEFCPHPDALDIFVCGTYKLDDVLIPSPVHTTNLDSDMDDQAPSISQHRQGQCLVFQVDPPDSTTVRGFHQIQTFDLPAVTDMKWCHRSPSVDAVLGIADSEGSITLHQLQEPERLLKQIDAVRCASSDVLCLSIDWSNRRAAGTNLGSLVVSLSNGSLCLLGPHNGGSLSVVHTWHAHKYEPWVAAWNYWDTNVIYSGGDDLKMKAWDVRRGFSQPLFMNERFDAGVTSIQNHPHSEHLIAVGSYDNTVRLFDTRKHTVSLTQIDVGGGAWRVKWHPSPARKDDLLVACMHGGFKVVSFTLDDTKNCSRVVKRFDAHESLAYGVDWSFDSFNDKQTIIGSCSFYDHVLHLWSG